MVAAFVAFLAGSEDEFPADVAVEMLLLGSKYQSIGTGLWRFDRPENA